MYNGTLPHWSERVAGKDTHKEELQEVTDGVTALIQGHPLRKEEKRNTALNQTNLTQTTSTSLDKYTHDTGTHKPGRLQ